jgi:hypothetical protein
LGIRQPTHTHTHCQLRKHTVHTVTHLPCSRSSNFCVRACCSCQRISWGPYGAHMGVGRENCPSHTLFLILPFCSYILRNHSSINSLTTFSFFFFSTSAFLPSYLLNYYALFQCCLRDAALTCTNRREGETRWIPIPSSWLLAGLNSICRELLLFTTTTFASASPQWCVARETLNPGPFCSSGTSRVIRVIRVMRATYGGYEKCKDASNQTKTKMIGSLTARQ